MQKMLDVQVPSRDTGRNVPCRIYRPKARGTLPVFMFIHGGGYSFGSIYVYDSLVRELADKSKCVIVSVDYRLSPEHKFPSGLEDCEDVLDWISSRPETLVSAVNSDPNRVAVGGDSAGGNFTASVAVYAKQKGINLAIQCLVYPATSMYCIPHWRQPPLPLPSDSAVLYSKGPLLNYSPMVWGNRKPL